MTTSPRSRFFRTGAASALAVTFLVSGCTNGKERGGTDEASGLEDAGDAVEAFVQDLNSDAPSPDPVDVDVSTDPSSTTLSAENIGISFEATDLADPRCNPDAGNLDDVLAELGSPGLRFGGNQLDRGMFWTSSGGTAASWQSRRDSRGSQPRRAYGRKGRGECDSRHPTG